ncbi:MAG: flagellar basal body FlaE domain protein [Enterobacter kobei]|nr:flagellar basal body FlaE domain protein [Enterobacter kobei]
MALLGTAGTGNFGSLTNGALESSNVDLSKELVNMIVAQRNYQSNAQTIKTQDQILNTLVNLR